MANQVNVGVDDNRNVLTFDRSSSELKHLKDQNFSFTIIQVADKLCKAQFQIKDSNGELLRENVSKSTFPSGAIEQKSVKLTKDAYVVKVKKQASFSLHDLF